MGRDLVAIAQGRPQRALERQAIDVEKNPAQIFLLFFISASFRNDDIFSWTVGSGDFHPKWYYMTRFVENAFEFRVEFRRFEQSLTFDWKSHFVQHGVSINTDESDSIEIETVTDAAFLDTPMMEYLRMLRLATFAMDDRLRASTQRQQQLLSTALLKKPSRPLKAHQD
jgi:hypothetical protein